MKWEIKLNISEVTTSLFGQSNTSGLFGGSTAANSTPAFGSSGFGGFGAAQSNGGLFSNTAGSTNLFGAAQNNSAFGAKPAGFGFGSTPTTTAGSLFGSTANTGLFNQPSTMGGGLFSNTSGGFGQQAATAQPGQGTALVKYQPVAGTDVLVKSGNSQSISIRHHCISCMKEYEGKSLEELRLEDYTAGRKGSNGVFGFQQTENKSLFNAPSFGQPAATTASLFGGNNLGGSTTAFGQTSAFSFSGGANTNTTGLFGGNKPAFGVTPSTGTSLFGATTTQAPTFGTTTPSFGFGSTQQNQTTGPFGAAPASTGFGSTGTTGFGSTATTGFGSFGTGGFFDAKSQQTTAPTFGTATPGE
ncbi:nuclear pore complex protein Nup98-Nup96-like [Leptidea sinapis]|uniref:nuclear pore complex protein Nup98-Nup96-like n=1 Tax=Leptidea sinapis TaxID=189913 RepID=UPI0021C48686|nr:nuclear pore complex protein Nup98-Nup96-like [Leptidea sinapis]